MPGSKAMTSTESQPQASSAGYVVTPPPLAIDVSLAASPDSMTPAAGTPTRREFGAAATSSVPRDSCERMMYRETCGHHALDDAVEVVADGHDYEQLEGAAGDCSPESNFINVVTAPRSLRVRFAEPAPRSAADIAANGGNHDAIYLLCCNACRVEPGVPLTSPHAPVDGPHYATDGIDDDDGAQPPSRHRVVVAPSSGACDDVGLFISNASLLSMPSRSPGSSGVSAEDFGGGLRRIAERATDNGADGWFGNHPLTAMPFNHHHPGHLSALSPAYSPPVSVPATPAPPTPCGIFRDEASASSFSRSAEHLLVSCIAGSSPTTSRTPGRRVRFGCVRVFAIPPREPRAPPACRNSDDVEIEVESPPMSRSSSGSSVALLASTSSPPVINATTVTANSADPHCAATSTIEIDVTQRLDDASPLISPLSAASGSKPRVDGGGLQLHSPTTPPPTPSAAALMIRDAFPPRRPRRSLSDYASENRGSIDSELRAAEAAATSRMTQARNHLLNRASVATAPAAIPVALGPSMMIPPPPTAMDFGRFQSLPPPVAVSFEQSLEESN